MGKYDDITPDRLRAEITRFARLLLKMEEDGVLLEKAPAILRLLGELRQMLFAYEVRGTKRLAPGESEDGGSERAEPAVPADEEDAESLDSLRIVREAVERERQFLEELDRDRDDGEDGDD